MGYSYVIFGAGRQGIALACDLIRNGQADRITLTDCDPDVLRKGLERLHTLCPGTTCRFVSRLCDAGRPVEVAAAMSGADVAVSAVPYRFNVALTDAAIAAGVSLCDLGGNTAVVRAQLERDGRARRAGVSILPDCGLAPGLGNILAAHGIGQLQPPIDAHIRCGGLPERPVGPLGYKLLFNFQGLINEYSGQAEFLRDGEIVHVPTLTEIEQIELPEPVGRCEAAVTSGGTSTCPATFRGRVRTYDYKTVRYPGHFAIVRALFDLGCFEPRVELPGGRVIEPKALMRELFEQRLAFPDVRDVTVLRVTVRGTRAGRPAMLRFDLLDRYDEQTGLTAMERTTAFPTALVACMQARGLIEPGARPLECALPLEQYVAELASHDIRIETTREESRAD